jgi:hypothetical protein
VDAVEVGQALAAPGRLDQTGDLEPPQRAAQGRLGHADLGREAGLAGIREAGAVAVGQQHVVGRFGDGG